MSILNTITEQLKNNSFQDKNKQEFIHQIKQGFPKTWHSVSPVLQPFYKVQHHLTAFDNISMDNRLVILNSLQKQILHVHHSAHRVVAKMTAHANI